MSATRSDFSWQFDDYSDNEKDLPPPTSRFGSKFGENSKSAASPTPPSEPLSVSKKPKRKKKQTYKLRETIETRTNERQSNVIVKCSQTGKQHVVKLKELSKGDGQPIMDDDLHEGSSLLIEENHNFYPVEFVKFNDDISRNSKSNKSTKPIKRPRTPSNTNTLELLNKAKDVSSKRFKGASTSSQPQTKIADVPSSGPPSDQQKIADVPSSGPPSDRQKGINNTSSKATIPATVLDNLDKGINNTSSKNGIATIPATVLDNSDKDLIVNLSNKIDKLQQDVEEMVQLINTFQTNGRNATAVKEEVVSYNGNIVDVKRIPAKTPYAYGLRLMDVLFSKEEMASSLLLESKSNKPPLDKDRVNTMFDLIDKKFNKWDLTILKNKCNQKCRDARQYCELVEVSNTDESETES